MVTIFGKQFGKRAQLEQKQSAAKGLIHMQHLGQPQWTPRDYSQLAKESYEQNAIAYRCVRLVAEAAAAMPMYVQEGKDRLDEHPFYKLIDNPNPFESREEILRSVYSFYQLAGNTYMELVALDKNPRELFVLRPDRMKMKIGRSGYPVEAHYEVGTYKKKFNLKVGVDQQLPIWHLKAFHPTNDTYGFSPVEAAAYAVDVHNEASAFNKSLLQNSATPSGALVYDPGKSQDGHVERLSDEQFARLKSEMDENMVGSRNSGKPLLLDGGMDWKEMGMNPKDLEFVEGKREAAREIALSFGVPPQLLGIPGDNTYSNYQEANRALYRQTVIPLVKMVYGSLSRFLRPSYGEQFCLCTDLDQVEALSSEREALWKRVNASKVHTVDEKRHYLGDDEYEPTEKPGGKIYVGISESPLGEDGDIVPGGPEPKEPEPKPKKGKK